jgi:TonB family protein
MDHHIIEPMKTTLIALFFILTGSALYGQDTLTIYYKENGKPTKKIEKSAFYLKVIHTKDRFYYQAFQTETDQLVQETELKSWKPLIEHGKTTYYDKSSKPFVATGYYKDGDLSGQWIFKTEKGFDTIDYSNADLKYMSDYRVNPKKTYTIVDQMPMMDYGADLKQMRRMLDEQVAQLEETDQTKMDEEKDLDPQRQIGKLNRQAFARYKADKLCYPIRALNNGIHGTVYLQFAIDETGKVVEPIVMFGVDRDLDKEAVRLVNSMDCWSVGMHEGKPVRVAITVGVRF